jgi:3-oxoadipate enol-lactonase
MPEVETGGCRISYVCDGPSDAPTLLMVNSLGTTIDLWAAQIPELTRRWRVVRYDARGHGRSTVPHGEYTIDRLGQDAVAVLDAVGAERADVCGISIGGMIAMWLGSQAPDRVGRLVMASTGAKIGTLEMWRQRIAQVLEPGGMPRVADGSMLRWFTESFRQRSSETVELFRSMVASCPPGGYAGCSAALRDADLRPSLGTITAPTLVISGDHDPSTTVADGEVVARGVPGARFMTLDAAHLCNVERASEFTAAIVDFLS